MKPSLQDEITTRTKASSNTKKHPDHNSQQTQTQLQQAALKCPRCDSTNTKFCYYNNYSLTQPRHFCKTCRRYWTKGGALRNVPIGGGCRKTKKLKSSSSSSSSNINSKLAAADDSPAFKFFAGISPSIDFQLNAALGVGFSSSSSPLFPRSCFSLDHHQTPTSPTTNNYSFMGLNNDNNNFPLIHQNFQADHNNTNSHLASSIESLSSLNQDLHWKLQQQRLAMIFGDHDHDHQVQNKDQNQKLLQPILFQNLEAPKQDSCFKDPRKESAAAAGGEDAATTEWFFGNNNSYDHHQVSVTNTSRNNIGGNAGESGWNHNNNNNNHGVQAWEDLHHFTALP